MVSSHRDVFHLREENAVGNFRHIFLEDLPSLLDRSVKEYRKVAKALAIETFDCSSNFTKPHQTCVIFGPVKTFHISLCATQ